MAVSAVTFNGAGVLQAGFSLPNSDHRKGTMRNVFKIAPENSETVVIKHGADPDLIRRVDVFQGGILVNFNTTKITSITRTDAETTTIVFPASTGGGNYTVVIEY